MTTRTNCLHACVVLRLTRRALAVAMVVAILFLLLDTGWRKSACVTDVFEKPEVAGFTFEISETDCWHSPYVSVFVISWFGGKTRLFRYTRYESRDGPGPYPLPVITEIGEHTHPDLIGACRRNRLPPGEVGRIEDQV